MTQDQTQEDFFTPSQFQTLEKMAAPGPLPVQFPYNLKATPYLHVRADLSCDELLYIIGVYNSKYEAEKAVESYQQKNPMFVSMILNLNSIWKTETVYTAQKEWVY